MKSYVFDIETDDIKATRIWCLSLLDTDTEEQFTYGPSEIHEGLKMLKEADKLIGHNILGFDIPVVKKLTGVDLYNKKLIDTLVLSRLFNPIREEGHSLEAWGYKLKYPKIDFEEYSSFSIKMLEYCERDVALNYKIYQYLKSEGKNFSSKSIELEHSVAVLVNNQRDYGFLFDFQHGMQLLANLNSELEKNKVSIQEDFQAKKEIVEIFPKYNSKNVLLKTGITKDKRNVRLSSHEFSVMEKDKKVVRINIEVFTPEYGWNTPAGKEITPTKQSSISFFLKVLYAVPV